jgi:hypothetical protein
LEDDSSILDVEFKIKALQLQILGVDRTSEDLLTSLDGERGEHGEREEDE